MTRALTLVLALLVAGAATTVALADHKPGHPPKPAKANGKAKAAAKQPKPTKIEICHRTMAGEDAHRTIRISDRAWPAHERHGDARGACTTNGEPAGTTAVGTTLAPVAPGAGGAGTFHLDIRLLKNGRARLCYTISVTGLDATLAQIRTLVAQDFATATDLNANALVARLKVPGSGIARGCVLLSREVADDIRVNPGEYFVSIATAAFPGGQIQGTIAVES